MGSFSSKSVVGIFLLGIFFSSVLIVRFCSAINALSHSDPHVVWTLLMVTIWFLGEFIISLIGIVGIYILKMYIETKQDNIPATKFF